MTDQGFICEYCGGPAIVHISGQISGKPTMRRLCAACADAEETRRAAARSRFAEPPSKRDVGASLVALGAFVLAISLFADYLKFGDTAGFGSHQIAGVAIAVGLVLAGALFRVLVVITIGIVFGGITLFADWLGFGSGVGFGWQQTLGTLLGVLLLVAGALMFKRAQ